MKSLSNAFSVTVAGSARALALTLGAGLALASGCGAQSRSADELPSLPLAAYGDAALAATKIWKVKADVLNCREKAGIGGAVVFELSKGSVVDVVDATKVKKDGYTWIHVNPRGDIDHNTCYLAADDRFLTPANGIDSDNYDVGRLYSAKVLKVKTPLNCREYAGTASRIIFQAMPVGTLLDVVQGGEFNIAWFGDAWWVHVNPRGDTDHNECWVSARKSHVTISE